MLEDIKQCYQQAELWMKHLPADADVNTVALMIFKSNRKKSTKGYDSKILDYDIEAVRNALASLGDSSVEMTVSDFIKNFIGGDISRSYLIRIGKTLQHLGFTQYHKGGQRLYKLHALR